MTLIPSSSGYATDSQSSGASTARATDTTTATVREPQRHRMTRAAA